MVRRARALGIACASVIALAACVPDLDDRTSRVASPQVLAIRAEPAEVKPKESVTFTALVVGPDGPEGAGAAEWALCASRKPLTELGPIDPACMAPAGPSLIPFGAGPAAVATIPTDACRLFGPDRPEPKPGEPAGRPVDPDGTGGYYQPIRVRYASGDAVSLVASEARIACGLSGVTPDQRTAYESDYRTNANPAPSALSIVRGDAIEVLPPASAGARPVVQAGARITLRAEWPACDPAARCAGAEPYLWFDPVARALTPRRESIRVSWFATGGRFDADRTGVSEAESGDRRSSDNAWIAPEAGAVVWIWIVVRDDRGGVGWETYRVAVD